MCASQEESSSSPTYNTSPWQQEQFRSA